MDVSDLSASVVFTCTHALIVGLSYFGLFIEFLAAYLHKLWVFVGSQLAHAVTASLSLPTRFPTCANVNELKKIRSTGAHAQDISSICHQWCFEMKHHFMLLTRWTESSDAPRYPVITGFLWSCKGVHWTTGFSLPSRQKPLGCLNAALGIIYADKTADALYLHQEGWRAACSQSLGC